MLGVKGLGDHEVWIEIKLGKKDTENWMQIWFKTVTQLLSVHSQRLPPEVVTLENILL